MANFKVGKYVYDMVLVHTFMSNVGTVCFHRCYTSVLYLVYLEEKYRHLQQGTYVHILYNLYCRKFARKISVWYRGGICTIYVHTVYVYNINSGIIYLRLMMEPPQFKFKFKTFKHNQRGNYAMKSTNFSTVQIKKLFLQI